MRTATLCSGIDAPRVAMPHFDWRWCAEIEKFPSAVLKHHRSDMPNLGDITALDFIERALAHGPLDALIAGTPCQAFSVAGLRRSLEDDRGNLTLRFVEIVHALKPGIVVWENVPGVLNTSDNAFGCFLGALVGADSALVPPKGLRWTDFGVVDGPMRSACWRLLDAQYAGLAQRRERVFVVASLRDWTHPAEILSEREGVQRHFAPRREAREDVTGSLSARTSGGGGLGTDFECQGGLVPDIAMCLTNGYGKSAGQDLQENGLIALTGNGFDASGDGTGRGTPLVPVTVHGDITHALDSFSAGRMTEDSTGRGCPIVAFSCKDHGADAGEISPTLRSMGHHGSHANAGGQVAVAFNLRGREGGAMPECSDVASLRAADGGSSRSYVASLPQGYRIQDADGVCETISCNPAGGMRVSPVHAGMAVRRLTPRECERLQGFPDDFTDVPFRGKPAADGPRYKALGNSMAVPVLRWILTRILEAHGS